MTLLEIIIAILFAKYGGGLLVSYDAGGEKLLGWLFLLAGVGVAAFAGSSAHAASIVKSPYVIQRQWAPASLVDGGFARCKTGGGCHGLAAPYPAIIANQGDVRAYAWNGVSVDNRTIAALWPIGQFRSSTPFVGVEGFADEWEGVKPQ